MMKPYYTDDRVTLYHGDCREVDANRTVPPTTIYDEGTINNMARRDIRQIIDHLRATAASELLPYTGSPANFAGRDDALLLNGYIAALDAIERELTT